MKLICCFARCNVEGLEHPTVSGFRIRALTTHDQAEGSTAAAGEGLEEGQTSPLRTTSITRACCEDYAEVMFNMRRHIFKKNVQQSGLIRANIKACLASNESNWITRRHRMTFITVSTEYIAVLGPSMVTRS